MDSNPEKARAGLVAVSILIIIYILGGGDISQADGTGKASFLGGSITFHNPWILQACVLTMFFYLYFVYKVSIKDNISQFYRDIYVSLLTKQSYIELLTKYIPKLTNCLLTNFESFRRLSFRSL